MVSVLLSFTYVCAICKGGNWNFNHVHLQMRHLYIIVDLSQAMNDKDLQPTRQLCVLKVHSTFYVVKQFWCIQLLKTFVEEFFDQNPISQVGLLTTRDRKAEKVTDLSGFSVLQVVSICMVFTGTQI